VGLGLSRTAVDGKKGDKFEGSICEEKENERGGTGNNVTSLRWTERPCAKGGGERGRRDQ